MFQGSAWSRPSLWGKQEFSCCLESTVGGEPQGNQSMCFPEKRTGAEDSKLLPQERALDEFAPCVEMKHAVESGAGPAVLVSDELDDALPAERSIRPRRLAVGGATACACRAAANRKSRSATAVQWHCKGRISAPSGPWRCWNTVRTVLLGAPRLGNSARHRHFDWLGTTGSQSNCNNVVTQEAQLILIWSQFRPLQARTLIALHSPELFARTA